MGTGKPNSAEVQDFSGKTYSQTAAAQNVTTYSSSYHATASGETTESSYQNTNWKSQLGAYLEVGEYAGLIDRKANYVVGKGFIADKKTQEILKSWKGNGLDSANMIFYNAVRTYTLGGDFYAEVIRNKRGVIRNLKPLNPSTIKVLANNSGVITKYEQYNINQQATGEPVETFEPKEIFHLAYNRIADQIHGQSATDKLTDVFEARRELMKDIRVVFHRYVKPLLISSVDTDDTAEITAYKNKLDNAMEKGENMVVPKGVLDGIEKMSIPQFSTLDPLPWLKALQLEFLKVEGLPGIVLGVGAESTEAESKILYLGWQQVVEFNQMFLEEQIKSQLGISLEFEFPASIEPDLMEDEKKDSSIKKESTEAGVDSK